MKDVSPGLFPSTISLNRFEDLTGTVDGDMPVPSIALIIVVIEGRPFDQCLPAAAHPSMIGGIDLSSFQTGYPFLLAPHIG